MNDNTSQIKKKYFAAANSYDGFISYFDSVFNPKEYSRLFVLKGGPGTGKNSFMRGIQKRFSEKRFEIEEIYCSSDPTSLDGIIIKDGAEKIAVIDGTAPHERDTRVPGAVDEIVNLGQNWDTEWLSSKRDKIIALNDEKQRAYSTAYQYLKIGKGAFEFIKNAHISCFDFQSAKMRARKLLEDVKKTEYREKSVRLVSAFGKDGSVTLDTIDKISENSLKISGNYIDAMLFICVLMNQSEEKEISYQLSPYPLCNSLYEAVYFPDSRMGIAITAQDGDVDAETFSKHFSTVDASRIKKAEIILNDAKDEAIRWFKIASDLHFRLEDIYSMAMSFEENDKLLEKTISEIETIFDKQK